MAKKQPTYEEAMLRLEQIASQMEKGDFTIDQLCHALQEAQTLIKFCREKLYQTDKQIQEILHIDEENSSEK